MQTVRGIYKNGQIEILEEPDIHINQALVLITFLVDTQGNYVELSTRGINKEDAANLRKRLNCFVSDWNLPEMDAYDKL